MIYQATTLTGYPAYFSPKWCLSFGVADGECSYDGLGDAIGNALGNSIVSAGQSTPQVKSIDAKLSEPIAQFGRNVIIQTVQEIDKSTNQYNLKTHTVKNQKRATPNNIVHTILVNVMFYVYDM